MSNTVDERQFIRNLSRTFPVLPPVEVGIGDDGAVLAPTEKPVVVVTDLLLDGVHFDLRTDSPKLAGRKAIAVNLSDLAAMGCKPTGAFVSLALPRPLSFSAFLSELYGGISEILTEFNTTLAGGDTNSWNGPFAVNVCLTGVPVSSHAILRSTAQPDHHIFVTGPLGGSLPSKRHLTFRPKLIESNWLATRLCPHAMMDISDGLSIDLLRLAEASGVGVELLEHAIPIHSDVDPHLPPAQRLNAALSDGEDFELLVILSSDQAKALESKQIVPPFPLYEVGRLTSDPDCEIIDPSGKRRPLLATGWQHL